jgi:UDP-glucose 4-epimerase
MAAQSSNSIPQKILLTGARGRLASCILPHLQQAGREVIGFSREEAKAHPKLENIFQPGVLETADTLLHLAWSTLPATSERDIGSEWESDLPFLIKLLRRIVESPARARLHFIFFSSGGAVYGPGSGQPSREVDPCHPVGWYAQAKVAAEEIIQIFGERHGLIYTILRVSNPYGFTVPIERAQGIIPHVFSCAWSGKPLSLWGDGTARKDFLHYTDFNRGLQAVIDRRLTGTYNLALGSSASISDVIRQIEAITQKTVLVEAGPARPWDVHTSLLDNAKLREVTGWVPQVSLEEGLKLTARELPR